MGTGKMGWPTDFGNAFRLADKRGGDGSGLRDGAMVTSRPNREGLPVGDLMILLCPPKRV